MKMKLFDRILLVLLTLLGIALFLGAVACAFDVVPLHYVTDFVELMYANLVNRIILGAVAIIGLAICVKLLFSHESKPLYPSSAVIRQGEYGAVTITVQAIDVLVQKAAHGVEGIRELKTTVNVMQEGLMITLRVALLPDTVIPETSTLMQNTVKEYIEKYAGIKVNAIKVLVDEATSYVKRVD